MKGFFADGAKARVKDAIVTAESSTSAEVVVTLKPASASYREIDYAVGALFAMAVLCVLLFHPADFDVNWFPAAVIAAFALGAFATAAFWPLKRALISKRRQSAEVSKAACEAFVRMGIHRTTGRSGMLVYVSAFERRADLVLDVGLHEKSLGAGWTAARARIEAAAAAGDVEQFAAAIAAVGKTLEPTLPRTADDVNELPDEVH